MDSVKARTRAVGGRYYTTLLNSLTLDQIKSAIFRLKRGDVRNVRSRADAIDAIESAGWVEQELNAILLDIESKSPTRHSAISKFTGAIPEFKDSELFQYLPATVRGLQFRPVYQRQDKDFISITFEHEIEVKEWEDDAPGSRRLIVTKIRHPIVARFYVKLKVVAFYFPGFSQGNGQKASDRLSYEDVVSSLTSSITYKFSVAFQQFPVSYAIKFLQTGDSPEIKVIRTDMNAGVGKVSLDSPLESNSVSDLLFSFLKPHISDGAFRELKKAIKLAIDGSHADHFVVYWCKERVVTRVRLWSFACEFMFVWNGTESSFRSIDSIIQLLVSVSDQYASPSGKALWDFILSSTKGAVITQI